MHLCLLVYDVDPIIPNHEISNLMALLLTKSFGFATKTSYLEFGYQQAKILEDCFLKYIGRTACGLTQFYPGDNEIFIETKRLGANILIIFKVTLS